MKYELFWNGTNWITVQVDETSVRTFDKAPEAKDGLLERIRVAILNDWGCLPVFDKHDKLAFISWKKEDE
jgi:hypothetical protein